MARVALVFLIVVAVYAPSTQAAPPGRLGSVAAFSERWDSAFTCEWSDETDARCRTTHYCEVAKLRYGKGGRVRGWSTKRCVKVAPWQRGTRTG